MRLTAPTEDDIVCDVVHPNVGVESWYFHTLDTLLQQMRHEIETGLKFDWQVGKNLLAADRVTFVTLATGAALDAARPKPLNDLVKARLDKWAKRWTGKWSTMQERIAHKFATKAWTATDNGVRASFKKAGFTLKFKPTRVMQFAYSVRVQTNVNLIRSIPEQYLKDVGQKVWDCVQRGSDMNELSNQLTHAYGIAARRAAFIARDQNNKAKAAYEDARRAELGIEFAEWAHSGGGKEPRPTHVKAGRDKVRYKITKGWFDPAINKHTWPGYEISCRCTSRAIIPGLK